MNQTVQGIKKDQITPPTTTIIAAINDLTNFLPYHIVLPNKAYLIDWGDACKLKLSDPINKQMFQVFVRYLQTIQNPDFNEKTTITDIEKQFNRLKKTVNYGIEHDMVRQYLLQTFRKHVNLFISCMNGIGSIMYSIYNFLGPVYQLDTEMYKRFLEYDVCQAFFEKCRHEGMSDEEIIKHIEKTAKNRDQLFRLYMYIDF